MLGSVLLAALFIVYRSAEAYDATLIANQTGEDVVDASISRVQDTCIFTNDLQFMRRVAYVETTFGNDKETNNGGLWQLTEAEFNLTLQTKYSSYWNQINSMLGMNYTELNYKNGDLFVPLYDAVSTRLYLNTINAVIPWTVEDQANFWVKYYNPSGTAQNFIDKVANIPDVCNSPGADVLFIIDGSGSVGLNNFNTMLKFLVNIFDNFTISQDDYQFAVLVFSDNVDSLIQFNSYNWNVTVLQDKVSKLQYPGGGTRTDIALNYALSTVFTSYNGVRPDDEGYPRVIVVLTDGQSNVPAATATAAQQDKDAGLVLFSVGVGGSYNLAELKTIASDPVCMHVYTFDDFAGIEQGFPTELKAQTCVAPAIIQPNNSQINHVLSQNQYMYFEFTANTTAGITFNLQMSQGSSNMYMSLSSANPNDVSYDYKITSSTSSVGSIFISPSDLSVTDSKFVSFAMASAMPNDSATIFASIEGVQTTNNFTLNILEGDHRISSASNLFAHPILFVVATFLMMKLGSFIF